MALHRFQYSRNIESATRYADWRSAFWPPADGYRIFCLDLARTRPELGPALADELDALRALVEDAWRRCKGPEAASERYLHNASSVASTLRRIAALLPSATDSESLRLRADAVERGYDDHALDALGKNDEEIAFVAGKLSTWFGKQTRGLPTAFGCVRDPARSTQVAEAQKQMDAIATYLRSLHAHLRLGKVPAFSATQLFFMAGEGNRHPKHIAYFLPEDEGVKRSPFKKTYYFANTHNALLNAVSLPLAARLLDLAGPMPDSAAELHPIPTLGVLAHEIGHFVHREGVSYAALNAADRWTSVMMQEMAADVFGVLIVAEVLAPLLRLAPQAVIAYHLAECLRYVDRGLGCFPDSDGMYLQLSYLASFGALSFAPGAEMKLAGDPEVVVAGFRSLARVLADTLLAGDVDRSLALCRSYGPQGAKQLEPLLAALREQPPKSIEYLQERHSVADAAHL